MTPFALSLWLRNCWNGLQWPEVFRLNSFNSIRCNCCCCCYYYPKTFQVVFWNIILNFHFLQNHRQMHGALWFCLCQQWVSICPLFVGSSQKEFLTVEKGGSTPTVMSLAEDEGVGTRKAEVVLLKFVLPFICINMGIYIWEWTRGI